METIVAYSLEEKVEIALNQIRPYLKSDGRCPYLGNYGRQDPPFRTLGGLRLVFDVGNDLSWWH